LRNNKLPMASVSTRLAALLLFSTLFMWGCSAPVVRTGALPVDPPEEELVVAASPEVADSDSFDDDPFADDPFEDDPFGDDPFDEDDGVPQIADPLEPVNRAVFWFNDKLYFYLLKPAVRGYRHVVPPPVRNGIGNFLSNLTTPVRMVNSLLQLKTADATRELFRFVINSTVGVLGVFDVARDQGGLIKKREDLGQTLATYGVGHGIFITVPFFGPTSVRDAGGFVGDYFLNPLLYVAEVPWNEVVYQTLDGVNSLSQDKDSYEAIIKQSLDPYLTIRTGYVQRRAAQVAK
jgi:phospholipid-binding lipoprotein MlaA